MAIIQVCDVCQNAVRGDMYNLEIHNLPHTLQLRGSIKGNSQLSIDICEACNSKIKSYIRSITAKPLFK